jgi:hypothetical protein
VSETISQSPTEKEGQWLIVDLFNDTFDELKSI